MSEVGGRNVLITGGASGIGRLIAINLARLGARVVLWDIHWPNLERTVAEVTAEGAHRAQGFLCDVSKREEIYRIAEKTRATVGPIDVLVHSAGVVSGKPLLEIPDEKIEATFAINTLALYWVTKAFLGDMIERDRGHIVTIASASGLIGVARLSDYSASKWAAIGFDESLRFELKRLGSHVRTTVVCPYYINTGMFRGVKSRFPWLLPILEEEKVASCIVRAILGNKARVIMPRIVNLVPVLRALPVPVFDWIAFFLGVNTSMDQFVGRATDARESASEKNPFS